MNSGSNKTSAPLNVLQKYNNNAPLPSELILKILELANFNDLDTIRRRIPELRKILDNFYFSLTLHDDYTFKLLPTPRSADGEKTSTQSLEVVIPNVKFQPDFAEELFGQTHEWSELSMDDYYVQTENFPHESRRYASWSYLGGLWTETTKFKCHLCLKTDFYVIRYLQRCIHCCNLDFVDYRIREMFLEDAIIKLKKEMKNCGEDLDQATLTRSKKKIKISIKFTNENNNQVISDLAKVRRTIRESAGFDKDRHNVSFGLSADGLEYFSEPFEIPGSTSNLEEGEYSHTVHLGNRVVY